MEQKDRPITLFPRAQASTNQEIRRPDTKVRQRIQKPLEHLPFKQTSPQRKVEHQVLPKQLHLALAAEPPIQSKQPDTLGSSARRLTIRTQDPNSQYQACHKYKDSNIYIAYRRSSTANVTVLKLVAPNESNLHLFQTNHDNVLGMQECFRYEGNIFCIYSIVLERTLRDVSVSFASLEEPALAAISLDVLKALRFIQIELEIWHHLLEMDHIVYDFKAGNFKLILASMAEMPPPDAQAVGYLMRQVMERESGIQPQARTVQLSQPGFWSQDAEEFLLLTQTASCLQLLQVTGFHSQILKKC